MNSDAFPNTVEKIRKDETDKRCELDDKIYEFKYVLNNPAKNFATKLSAKLND